MSLCIFWLDKHKRIRFQVQDVDKSNHGLPASTSVLGLASYEGSQDFRSSEQKPKLMIGLSSSWALIVPIIKLAQ